jgi:hypothetical protein
MTLHVVYFIATNPEAHCTKSSFLLSNVLWPVCYDSFSNMESQALGLGKYDAVFRALA